MQRGYIKLWRRAEDSRAWSRGIEYRGLLATLLLRANYKETSFGGQKIMQGQVATSMQRLADDLGITRDKLIRMLCNLQKDGVISHSQAHNRFTIITILNFSQYQSMMDAPRTTDRTTDHTTPAQQPHTSKEGKNILYSSNEEYTSPEVSDDATASDAKKPKDEPPSCPHQQVIALYREILPSLTAPRTWDGNRAAQLRARWREAWERLKRDGKPHGAQDVLNWWRRFFETVKQCSFLMGQVNSRSGQLPFTADLEWLTKKTNFAKVLDGKYLDRRPA